MSGSLNKCFLIGHLGQDPEIKVSPSGDKYARFSVATTERWKNAQGEKQEKTEWHNIVVNGKLVDVVEKYLHKGQQVSVEGKIQYREYTDRDGTKKVGTSIRCENLVMLGKPEDGVARQDKPASAAPRSASPHDDYDDDIAY
jgi:single-strand DNA-binding protein